MEIVLTRWWTDEHRAQVGRLVYPGGTCFTLEDVWIWNRRNISCIPLGFYEIERDTFRGRYENFAVRNVIGRTAIELHRGNTDADTEGCILLGSELHFDPRPRLGSSGIAFDRFMEAMEGVDKAVLAIVDGLQRPAHMPAMGGI